MSSSARFRQALVLVLAAYGFVCLRDPAEYRLLDAVDLPIHETGHLVFAPFGEFLQFLGGSLFQVLFPLAFVAYHDGGSYSQETLECILAGAASGSTSTTAGTGR